MASARAYDHFFGVNDDSSSSSASKTKDTQPKTASAATKEGGAPGASDKLRVVCLHGKWQNAESFRKKLGSFRKNLKSLVDFEFVNAPFLIREETAGDKTAADGEEGEDGYEWFQKKKDPESAGVVHYEGATEAVKAVRDFIADKGPFDGILGFSQGGLVASLLAHLSESVRFVIIVAAFTPQGANVRHLLDRCLVSAGAKREETVPTLHVFGEGDTLITPDRSRELAALFGAVAWNEEDKKRGVAGAGKTEKEQTEAPEEGVAEKERSVEDVMRSALMRSGSVYFRHPGGHYVPTVSEAKTVFRTWLSLMKEQKVHS
uniref:Serine hydrolase domain-containing protein n=1 Tax=Chromera velia CCMP2878 TaxID=1169474 RepID=A0A0G4G556_9ALVE|eukprot:Cvel_20211.t1-p1 / transcript=Cvel_20211.t1 / gene=Cvel_20211 / organism=Chromera_velia_CCMP2878 / gene_product=Ovarian cancer-associated gene 2 protein homolog, putative / transcript_product=Ovarian cancer-associated gene 2 protein homolog, putative / location=Cvel_scaffold1798:27632-28908(+) / protein_length=317 / sequence_SO=supercontig / SO=protein_coding / is_pseudo=false